jgi:hypothetical protein
MLPQRSVAMPSLELPIFIETLRQELLESINQGDGKDVKFFTEKIEMELEVIVEHAVGGRGEAKWRFLVADVTASGDAHQTTKRTQKLKLSLVPGIKGETGVYLSASGTKLVG